MDPTTPPTSTRPALGWFLLLDGGLLVLACLVVAPPLARRLRSRGPLPSDQALRWLLLAAILVHVSEALAAWALASRRGLAARPWVLQTALVGFPSLRLLRAHTITR